MMAVFPSGAIFLMRGTMPEPGWQVAGVGSRQANMKTRTEIQRLLFVLCMALLSYLTAYV